MLHLSVAVTAAWGCGAITESACTTAMECSLHGECVAGACKCDPGWAGRDCGVLKLAPTATNDVGSGAIYPPPGSNMSSWGGGVIRWGGKYHLFVSEMGGHCGLATWSSNSLIRWPHSRALLVSWRRWDRNLHGFRTCRHAVSDTVDGSYAPAEAVMPAWSHNAMPQATRDGFIALWHIGNGTTPRPPGPTAPTAPPRPAGPRLDPGPIPSVPYSSDPSGPWRQMDLKCHTPEGPGLCDVDNPTPASFDNGTTLLAHRAKAGFGLLSAPHWSGPYTNINTTLGLRDSNIPFPEGEYSCEDGFLFHGPRGVHLLCHCNGVYGYPWDDHGRHAFSADGLTWKWSDGRTFLPVFMHPDGTNTTHIARQRPQLVFAPDGTTPTHLITGISVSSTNRPYPWQEPCPQLSSVTLGCDLTNTAMQSILP
eukprot:gene3709-690_t